MQNSQSQNQTESPKTLLEHTFKINKTDRESQKNQKAFCVWFTGLSASGKSTLANALDVELFKRGKHSVILDSDTVRKGLCGDLGFSEQARDENIRRVGEVTKIMTGAGLICITAFISPFAREREQARALHEDGTFIEVFLDCPIDECEKRDPKGMYKKAHQNIIYPFTGVHSPYENPTKPEIVLNTKDESVDTCIKKILIYLENKKLI
jgi:adenylylsulfate kinase